MRLTVLHISLFVVLFVFQISNGQSNRSPEIDKYLDEKILDINSVKDEIKVYNKNKISQYEAALLKTNDTEKILDFYNKLVFRITLTNDLENTKVYLAKIKKILSVYKSKRQLGFYYFTLGYCNHFSNTLEQRVAIYQKSADLIEKYGDKAEMLQISYLLARTYLDKRDISKAIKYGNIVNRIIEKTAFVEIETINNNNTLFECYLKMNKLDSAQYFMNKILLAVNEKEAIPKYVLSRFYNLKALYLLKTKKDKEAISCFDKSDSLYKLSLREERQKLKKTVTDNVILTKREIENNKRNNQKILLLVLLFLCSLLVLVFLYIKIKSNNQLIKKSKELDVINQKLNRSIASKNMFIDSIAHEIKTPINSIKSISYLFGKNPDLISEQEYISTLNFASDYLNNLITNFVQYNSTHQMIGGTELQIGTVDLKKLLVNILHHYQLKNTKSLVYNLDFDEAIDFSILADETKLSQLFFNLLNNSSKFTEQGSVAILVQLIAVAAEKATLQFEVSDTGIGIDLENIEAVFEPFVQESKEINYRYGGFGIGLSIVKSYIELMGGTIAVASEKNKGTTISFTLSFEIVLPQLAPKSSQSAAGCKRVLLVEDNLINQRLTKKIINSGGHNCEVANNGLEAVNMVKNNIYDLVFMDIMMPIMDGYEALEKIKKIVPNLPIIALTSLTENLNRNYKFDEFLTKPTPPNRINEIIETFG